MNFMSEYVRLPITETFFSQFGCTKQDPIDTALSRIRSSSAGFCVIHDGVRMIGIICESEIRKAWIAGAELTDPCGPFINDDPVITSDIANGNLAVGSGSVRCMPELEESSGELVAVWLREQSPWQIHDVTVLIMAGGLGKRMGDLTANVPKPLLEVCPGVTLLDNILASFAATGFQRIQISVNYLKEQFFNKKSSIEDRYGLQVEFVEEPKFLGTAGSVGRAAEDGKGMIVVNGDVYTTASIKDFLDYSYSTKADLVIMAARQKRQEPFGVLYLDAESRLTDFVEKPVSQYFVAAGIYYLSERVLGRMFELATDGYIDMPDLITKAKLCGLDVRVFPIFEEWVDVGNPTMLAEVREKNRTVKGDSF